MILRRVEGNELVNELENMWPSYLISFPPDAQRTRAEMAVRVTRGVDSGFQREVFYTYDSEVTSIGIYHVCQELPFCYGEYIWTKEGRRNASLGFLIHKTCIQFLSEQGIKHFISEGHEDNPWHHRIGLGTVPVRYLQPAIYPGQKETYMSLLYDVNLGGIFVKAKTILNILNGIYKGIYKIDLSGSRFEMILHESIAGRDTLKIEV